MRDKRKEIQPKHFFKVFIPTFLSDQEKEVVTFLYQPIIGAHAFSLYFTLLSEVGVTKQSEELLHADLIMMLDISMPQLLQAQKKLEGIGLLETYLKEDSELGLVAVYQLNHPETPERFFQDEVLTLVLHDAVGQRKLAQLVEQFKPVCQPLAGYQNVSASFNDVYSFKEEKMITYNEALHQISDSMKEKRPKREIIQENSDFDWSFFLKQIQLLHLQLPDNPTEFQRLVYVLHEMYGINELEMADFASKSFDYVSNQIVIKEFKALIEAEKIPRRKQQQIQRNQQSSTSLSIKERATYRYNSLKQDGFSDADIQTILMSEKLAPGNYLRAMKQSDGGYPTKLEIYSVNYLIQHSGLPNSVINILLNFVYAVEKKPVLESEHLNKIANDWARKNIHSPEEAIKYVRQRNNKKKQQEQQRKVSQANYQTKRPIRQESLPDWVGNPVKEEKVTTKEQEEIDQRIQKLLRKEDES